MNSNPLFLPFCASAIVAAACFSLPPAAAQDKPASQPASVASDDAGGEDLRQQIAGLRNELQKVKEQTAAEIEAMKKKLEALSGPPAKSADGTAPAGQASAVAQPAIEIRPAKPVFKRVDDDNGAPVVLTMTARAAAEPSTASEPGRPAVITFRRLDDEDSAPGAIGIAAAGPEAKTATEPVKAEPFPDPKSFVSAASKIAFTYDPATGSWTSKPGAVQDSNGEKFAADTEKELKNAKHIPADAVLFIQPDRSILIESESLKPQKAGSAESKSPAGQGQPEAK